jgi:hypothetical protein
MGGLLIALGMAVSPTARAQTTINLRLDQEAPRGIFAKPTKSVPKPQPNRVVADNVRAVAVLYAVWRYERAGVFKAGDRLVADFKAGSVALKGPAAAAVSRLAKAHQAAPSAADRAQLITFVADLVREQFSAIVEASTDQMNAYADLVASVAASLDQFMDENVSSSSGRDSIQSLVLGVSNAGYGAVHYAAARLSEHAHELTHVLQQKSVQAAYGAKDAADLVTKLGGGSRATVERELARAEAGTLLLLWLRHVNGDKKLAARAKQDGVAALIARLKKLGDFRAPTHKPGAKAPKPTLLCMLPGAKKPTRCAFSVSK